MKNYDIWYKEISLLSHAQELEHIKKVIHYAEHNGIDGLVVPPVMLKHIKTTLDIVCPIDYPYGFSDTETRYTATMNAIKNGAKVIDLTFNNCFYSNKAYDLDIEKIYKLCQDHDIVFRVLLDCKLWDNSMIRSVAKKLARMKIEYVIPSLSCDVYENLLFAGIFEKEGIASILCGNIYSQEVFNSANSQLLYGIRFDSTYHFERVENFNKE